MPHFLWNLNFYYDVHKSATTFCPEPDKSIHTLTHSFSKVKFHPPVYARISVTFIVMQ
jgi:hypothetical protein